MQLAQNTQAARWIVDRLHPFASDVGGIIPDGFEAYARIFHPPYQLLVDGTRLPVRWRNICAANHKSIEVEMQQLGLDCTPARTTPDEKLLWEDALNTLSIVDWSYRSPNLWWPDDRAWCVATEVDYSWTYVAGTVSCIEELLNDPTLEAIPTTPEEGNSMEKRSSA